MAKYSTNPAIYDFFIERDINGYYYISDDLVTYCDLKNGYIFRIRNLWRDWDWLCYQELADKARELGTFRVDIPLYRQEILIDAVKWEYAELQSPGKNYGQNFDDDVFSWPELTDGLTPNTSIDDDFRNQVFEYYKEFVNQSLIVMTESRKIAEKNNCGMPYDLCHLFARYRDDSGYFWSDFDQHSWVQTKEEVIRDALQVFGSALKFAEVCGVLDQTRIGDLFQYASEKWQTI